MKSVLFVPVLLIAVAGCAADPADQPVDEAAVRSFLERQLAEAPPGTGENVKKLDATANSLMKAPLERSDSLVAAMAEGGI